MGLLEDLEQETKRRRAALDEVERAKHELEQTYKTRLEPGLQALHAYLVKLTTDLNFVKPPIQVRYEFPGYGTVLAQFEHEYDLQSHVLSAQSRQIVLQFVATVLSEHCPLLAVQGAARIRTLNAFFQRAHLSPITDFKRDEAGQMVQAMFRARGKIVLKMIASASAATGTVQITFTNFDAIGTASKSIPAALFDEHLFEEIGRFIVRDPNQLFREPVSDELRRQLAQKVEQEQVRRRWESHVGEPRGEPTEDPRQPNHRTAAERGDESDHGGKPASIMAKVKGLFQRR